MTCIELTRLCVFTYRRDFPNTVHLFVVLGSPILRGYLYTNTSILFVRTQYDVGYVDEKKIKIIIIVKLNTVQSFRKL